MDVSTARNIRNIALIGFMGTGKSSVGRMLADQLRFSFLDTDEEIEARVRKPVSAIFSDEGEPRFRQYEKEVVAELAARSKTIISTGGGLGADAANLASLKEHALTICLWASPEKIWERVRYQSHRPLLRGPDALPKIRDLLAVREPVYKQADVLMNTELRSLREVVQQVVHQFHLATSRRG